MSIVKDVLSIEDEADTVVGTIAELELLGFTVDKVKNLCEAREKLKNFSYRVFLVDLRLPEAPELDADVRSGVNIVQEIESGNYGDVNSGCFIMFLSGQNTMMDLFVHQGDIKKGPKIDTYRKGASIYPLIDRIEREVKSRR